MKCHPGGHWNPGKGGQPKVYHTLSFLHTVSRPPGRFAEFLVHFRDGILRCTWHPLNFQNVELKITSTWIISYRGHDELPTQTMHYLGEIPQN